MPLVHAFRALLVLLALFAIVPTQTGGALAVDDFGFETAEASAPAGIGDHGPKKSPAKPAHHASFAAPDDGTAAGAVLPDWPRITDSPLPSMTTRTDRESAAGTRLDRPPKSI